MNQGKLTCAFAWSLLLACHPAWAVDPNPVIDLRMYRVGIRIGNDAGKDDAGKALMGSKWVPKFTVQAGVTVGLYCDLHVILVEPTQWKTKVKRTVQYAIKVDDSTVVAGGEVVHYAGQTIQAGPSNIRTHTFQWAAFPGQHRITCIALDSGFEEPNLYNNTVEALLDVTPAQVALGTIAPGQHAPQQSAVPPIAGARAVLPVVAQSPDLTSAPQLEVAGKHPVAWNSSLALTDADARSKSNGTCHVAFAHVMRNTGTGASGPFSRRWRNQGMPADMNETAPSIPAGASLARTDTLALKPGVNQLSFGLDPTNQVKEMNETNNSFGLIVTLNGTCGSTLAKAQAAGADGLRFGPAQAANSRLPAVQQQPGPPTSQVGQRQR